MDVDVQVWMSVQVYECVCICAVRGLIRTIIIYSSSYLLFSPSLSLPSSHHLLISCLLQFKSLHPFAFGDSASDHSKMDLSVSSKRWRLTALNMLRVLHAFPSHTHMHWVRYVVTCHRHVIIPILLEGGALQ